MTVSELMEFLKTCEPSAVVVTALYQRRGDPTYVIAEDQVRDATIQWHGDPCGAIVIGAGEADEVEVLRI
jgi:UDP-glucose 4-epimerase